MALVLSVWSVTHHFWHNRRECKRAAGSVHPSLRGEAPETQ
jgi:hypothetical protein